MNKINKILRIFIKLFRVSDLEKNIILCVDNLIIEYDLMVLTSHTNSSFFRTIRYSTSTLCMFSANKHLQDIRYISSFTVRWLQKYLNAFTVKAGQIFGCFVSIYKNIFSSKSGKKWAEKQYSYKKECNNTFGTVMQLFFFSSVNFLSHQLQ